MNDFDDFDGDTPPQGGQEDDMEAEYQASLVEQRRLDQQRQDDDLRDADNRRDAIQEDIDRRDDQERLRLEAVARQAEVDDGMEFSMGDPVEVEPEQDDDILAQAKARHTADMDEHRQKAAMLEADQALQAEQGKDSFYKSGFTDLKGNQVSARDVNAIMANHQAAGGHEAAQERFGLANDKGSELSAAYYASNAENGDKGDKPVAAEEARSAPSAAPVAGLNEKETAIVTELDRIQSEDSMELDEGKTDWAAQMGVNDQQALAIAQHTRALEVREHFLESEGSSQDVDTSQTPSVELGELSQRLNDPTTAEHQEAMQEPDDNTDWSQRMQEVQAERERQREREEQGQGQGLTQAR